MRYLFLILAVLALSNCAFADDVVTMPTANQLKQGEVDVAAYHFGLDMPSAMPQDVNIQALNIGITNRLELDAYRADVDKDETATVLTGYFKVLSESPVSPDLVVGCKNLAGADTTANPALKGKSEDRSYFVAASKTVFFVPTKPGPPLVRVHLGLGTEDWTLLGEKRHDGIFGGLQFLLRPDVGLVLQNDGTDTITGLSYMPIGTGLTIKGGTFGDHWWMGLALRKAISL